MTGGEAIVQLLGLHGVEIAFGMGGFQLLPYYDALARQETVRHVLIRDEKHGAFAADAWARVTNRPAVADATVGPGTTNLVSGAAESFGASIPMVLLTGEINQLIAGRGATQESDQFGMLRPTTKLSVRIDCIERIPELVRHALRTAVGGRPGPVHIDVPEDVFHGVYDFDPNELYADPAGLAVGGRRTRGDPSLIEQAAEILGNAERPVVILGGGVHLSQAYPEVAALVNDFGIPAASTISGKGGLREDHPLSLGVCGRFTRFANQFIQRADVVLVVGSKLGEIATDRWTLFTPGTTVIQIDVDPEELGRVHKTDVGVEADAKLGLVDLLDALRERRIVHAEKWAEAQAEIAAVREEWRTEAAPSFTSGESPLHMGRVVAELQRALPPEAILVADGGFAAHWSALLYDVTAPGRQYIANRGHAAIGYGLPGAIGAKLAAPSRPVVALCGDNGFAMAAAEIETAKRVGAPVVAVVVNNGALGYVKALQHSLYDDRFISVDFLDVDYGKVAEAFGCEGRRVSDPDELAPALRQALVSDVPTVLDVMITTDPARMLPGVDRRTTRAAPVKS